VNRIVLRLRVGETGPDLEAAPLLGSGIVLGMSLSTELRDIDDRADCERLVRSFYARALADPIIGWIFLDVAKLDLEAHVPRITSFWETILLDARSYTGGAFAPHAALNARVKLRAGHFERWLRLWHDTIDELFVGERAELAKAHAVRVAQAFQRRLQAPPAAADSSPRGDGGLIVIRPAPSVLP
jgi:hemoglobin